MKFTAIVVGSASGAFDDLKEARKLYPLAPLILVNDAIEKIRDGVVAVSFHSEKMEFWLRRRKAKGWTEPLVWIPKERQGWLHAIGFTESLKYDFREASYWFPGQTESGSSGLFAVKLALIDFRFDRVICCGMPMDRDTGYLDNPDKKWSTAERHREGWKQVFPHLEGRVFSLSGWTKEFLGSPEEFTNVKNCDT